MYKSVNTEILQFYSVSQGELNVIGVSETWIQDSVNKYKLFPNIYNIYRSDRNSGLSSGGGVLLACNVDIRSEKLTLPHFDVLHLVHVVSCKCIFNFSTVYVFVIYFRPSTAVEQYLLFFDIFINLEFLYGEQLLIMGDFNIPDLVKSYTNVSKVSLVNNFQAFFDLN